MLWVNNKNIGRNELNFYTIGSAGDASGTIGGLWITAQTTEFIALDGITVNQDIWVSCLIASCEVRIAGVLMDSISM